MVTFYNIRVEKGILTALVINEVTGNRESITAKIDGTYHSSKDRDIIKATWGLVVESQGKNFPEKTSIAWG